MGIDPDAESMPLSIPSEGPSCEDGIRHQGRSDQSQRPLDQPRNGDLSAHAKSKAELLSLPWELRQRILEYVFTMPCPGDFPPRKSPVPYGAPTFSRTARSPGYLTALCLCRQIYTEAHVLPFRTNLVSCSATFGSNTTTTDRFLKRLRSFQRNAIKRLELNLLASMTETWSLISVLRLIANVAGGDELQDTPLHLASGQDPASAGASDLQALTINIGTRDLYLAQADSLTGLTHMLDLTPAAPAFLSGASWVTDGLVHLKALRRLTIAVEISGTVAQQMASSGKDQFRQNLVNLLPCVLEIKVDWKVVDDLVAKIDDNDWVNSLWSHDQAAMLFTHGASHDAYDEDLAREEVIGGAWPNRHATDNVIVVDAGRPGPCIQ
ncbi:hypothetical protein PV11_09408 [Exophiala sideris]|uniref:Uncharacterized protein n=1 Tax=Exophiala sideris TaxID=1016849 RepID=A0A0D1VNR2_9EURO|nr:hypothetical protein PV11_09408 [Exophiala sideris]